MPNRPDMQKTTPANRFFRDLDLVKLYTKPFGAPESRAGVTFLLIYSCEWTETVIRSKSPGLF